ncbi:MAG: FecR domain-containing protein [Synergistaceae bacterium]|nr:FecR domain-containing protein [Synergistaceae bacterium]
MKKIICILLVCGVAAALILFAPRLIQRPAPDASVAPDASSSDTATDTARAAVIDDFVGKVSADQEGGEMPAFRGLALVRSDSLGTGAESWSSLELNEGQFVMVQENSSVRVARLADEAKRAEIFVAGGKVWVSVSRALAGDETFEVRTPGCALSVRGTVFSVECASGGSVSGTRLAVYRGTVEMRAQDAEGNPILDAEGQEVAFQVSEGAAEVSVENGTVTRAERSELTSEDLAPLYASGPDGPGGLFRTLRQRLEELVWDETRPFGSGQISSTSEDRGPAAGKYAFTLDKPVYLPGGTITVEVSGVPEEMLPYRPWVGLYSTEAGHRDYIRWAYVTESDSVRLDAPTEPGGYEARAYAKNDVYTDSNVVGTVKFSVGGNSEGAYRFTLDKSSYLPGGTITVEVSGVPEEVLPDRPWVGLYSPEAGHRDYIRWAYVTESDSVRLDAPTEPGEYEARAYAKNNVYTDSNVVGTVKFSVGGNSEGAYRFTLDKSSYAPEEPITVEVSGVLEEMLPDRPWVGLYSTEAGHRDYIRWSYITTSAGSVRLNAPTEPGEYEARAYAKNDVYIDSNVVGTVRFSVRQE